MAPILRALLTRYRCHRSVELHEKRHRAIGVLRDSILQLIQKNDEGMSSVAGLGGNGKPYQSESSALLIMKAERAGQSVVGDQKTEIISVAQEDSSSPPRLVIANGSATSHEVKKTVRMTTPSRHLSHTTRGAENQKTYSVFDSLTDSHPGKNTARKSSRFQNHPLTAAEHERINEALHSRPEFYLERAATSRGNSSLAKNEIIDANIAFNSTTFNYPLLQEAAHQKMIVWKKGIKKSSKKAIDDSRITTILHRLGICHDVSLFRSKKCQSLLGRLRHAIYLDLVSVENEEREIMMRMAGYWRYVNRRTYNAMVRHNQLWDWATGAKLEELEISDYDEEEDEDAQQIITSQANADKGISQRPERRRYDEHCGLPVRRVSEDDGVTRTRLALDEKNKPASSTEDCRNGLFDKSKYSPSHIPPKGTDPKSLWAGIKDTRHLHKTPSKTPSVHSADTEHDASIDSNLSSLYSRSIPSSSAPFPMTSPILIPPPITPTKHRDKDKNDHVANACIKPPRTSFRGTASFAEILKRGIRS